MSLACQEDKIKGYYKYYQAAKISKACPYFVEDFEDYLEKYFMAWPNDLDVLTGVENVCDKETLACKDIYESKWAKPRFYLDGVEQPASMVTSGYSSMP